MNRNLEKVWLMVPHSMLSMPMMKDPPKSFGRIVGHVEGARDMFHQNITLLTPFLDCKELHINVLRACSRFSLVYHCNGCFIMFVEDGGLLLHKTKFFQDRLQISCCLGCMNCCHEFCLCRTCSNHGLQLGFVSNGCTSIAESPACNRSPLFDICGMCCINKTDKFRRRYLWELRI